MSRESVLSAMKELKKSHMEELQKIDFLIRGMPLNVKPTPVDERECEFGKWLYTNEKIVRNLLPHQQYEEIEWLHIRWHDEYNRIYEIFYPESMSFISRITRRHKASSQALEHARDIYEELKEISQKLIRSIDIAQKRVNALPDKRFEGLV